VKRKLAPSILSADFSKLGEEIKAVEEAGVDCLHLDVMDGHFVPNLTIGPAIIKAIRKVTELPFHTHLMIKEPERYIIPFAEAGSNLISFHTEVTDSPAMMIERIKNAGKKSGIAINPGTPISSIDSVLDIVDLVLVMSVNPGFGGQALIPETLQKITELKEIRDKEGYKYWIEVDGGVKEDNIAQVVKAGADIIVSGSGIFHQPNYAATISAMRKVLDQG